MRIHLKSFIFLCSFAGLIFFHTTKGNCQTEEKTRRVTNYAITLRYYLMGKIQKEVVLVSSSDRFSTTQKISDKFLTFSGRISISDNIDADPDFILKYVIYLREKKLELNGIQGVSGMRGLGGTSKLKEAIVSANACDGIVKLKDKQAIVLYTLSMPVGSSKKKVEPELEFEVSISKYKHKKRKR